MGFDGSKSRILGLAIWTSGLQRTKYGIQLCELKNLTGQIIAPSQPALDRIIVAIAERFTKRNCVILASTFNRRTNQLDEIYVLTVNIDLFTHLLLVSHICVCESGQRLFKWLAWRLFGSKPLSKPMLGYYRNWYRDWGHCGVTNDLGRSPKPEGEARGLWWASHVVGDTTVTEIEVSISILSWYLKAY